MEFGVALIDTDGFFDVSNKTRLTIPAGVKKISLGGQVGGGGVGTQNMVLVFKNGDTGVDTSIAPNIWNKSKDNVVQLTGRFLDVEEGDYFEFIFRSDASFSALVARTWFNLEVVE